MKNVKESGTVPTTAEMKELLDALTLEQLFEVIDFIVEGKEINHETKHCKANQTV